MLNNYQQYVKQELKKEHHQNQKHILGIYKVYINLKQKNGKKQLKHLQNVILYMIK